jgi:hypothetical protein
VLRERKPLNAGHLSVWAHELYGQRIRMADGRAFSVKCNLDHLEIVVTGSCRVVCVADRTTDQLMARYRQLKSFRGEYYQDLTPYAECVLTLLEMYLADATWPKPRPGDVTIELS